MSVKAIPEGYGTVTPYLVVKDSDELINFLKRHLTRPSGTGRKTKTEKQCMVRCKSEIPLS